MEEQHLLLIGVGVVGAILREVVEFLAVLVHTARTLLQVQELLKLASHQAHGDVVSTESYAELGPRHLVAILNSAVKLDHQALVGPRSCWATNSLLEPSVVQKPKLEHDDAKPVIRLLWISRLGKHQRMSRHEVGVVSLHPWLAVGRAHLTLHEVLRQHPHELILCGQQLLNAHG
jgi:hypothetical protein